MKVSQIFSSFYPNHCTLIDYLENVKDAICKPTDQQLYSDLLKNTIVCYNGYKPKKISLNIIHGFRIEELIEWIIKITCHSNNSSNVLSLGYTVPRDTDGNSFTSVLNEYPNSNVRLLLSKPSWRTLYDRIGDDLMVHLLKDVSLFLLVDDGCYVQVAGTPMYNLQTVPFVKNGSKKGQEKSTSSANKSEKVKINTQPLNAIKTSKKRKRKISRSPTNSKKQKIGSNSRPTSSRGDDAPDFFKVSTLYFPMESILYSSNLQDKFPKNHITSTTPANKRGAVLLIRDIFTRKKKHKAQKFIKQKKIERLSKRFLAMRPLFEQFLRRHKKYRPIKLLSRHCKDIYSTSNRKRAPEVNEGNDNSKDKDTDKEILEYENAVKSFTPTYQVFLFVKSVCKLVLPRHVWGTEDNEKAFYKNLKRFVGLRKGEMFSLGQMVDKIKPSSCGWLKLSKSKRISLSESEKQKEVFYQWVWWFVNSYIMVLLKCFFYITEGANQSKEIYYYRKPVWRVIQAFGIKTVTAAMLCPIPKSEAADLVKSNASLGYSSMRFLPKPSSVRPIVNMSSKPTANTKGLNLSINSKLRTLFEVIKFENKRNGYGAHSAVFGVDDVHRKLKSFTARRDNGNQQPLYFVHVDIYKCFDTIVLERLYSIMKAVFKEEEYIVRRFVMFKGCKDQVKKTFEKEVALGDDCRTFHQFTKDMIKEKGLRNMVFVDQVCLVRLEHRQALDILKKHLFNNIVKIGNCTYKQIQGIAQGSILSSYLCSQFYTHMEKRYFKTFLRDDSSLLLRWVDDFLFMTPDQSKADMFLTTMNAGIPKYGCQISAKKTLVNYATTTGIPVRHIGQNESFPWCGFLIDPSTLDVKADYSRYQDVKLKNSFTRSLHSHPGRVLVKRLSFSVRNKCHPLLLDLNLNSKDTVLTNLYEMFYWLALKFYWWCRDFPKGRQVSDNPAFIKTTVLSIPQLVCSAIERKFQRLSCLQVGCMVKDDLVKLLFYKAFIECLKTKPLYKATVKVLQRRYRKLRFTNPAPHRLPNNNPFLV